MLWSAAAQPPLLKAVAGATALHRSREKLRTVRRQPLLHLDRLADLRGLLVEREPRTEAVADADAGDELAAQVARHGEAERVAVQVHVHRSEEDPRLRMVAFVRIQLDAQPLAVRIGRAPAEHLPFDDRPAGRRVPARG